MNAEIEKRAARRKAILGILQEEAAEVIVAASKINRFGLADGGYGNNRSQLVQELADLKVMTDLAREVYVVTAAEFESAEARKMARLKAHAPEVF